MIRKQMYIDDDLDRQLKALASRTGRPEAEHVRAALRTYLQAAATPAAGERDPLYQLVGLVAEASGPTDVAEEHDHYLYGTPKRSRTTNTRPGRRRR